MPAAVPAPAAAPAPVIPAALIDEYGQLVRLRDAFAPTERQYKRVLEQIKAHVAALAPDASETFNGEDYLLRVSARGWESRPNVEKARKILGAEKFLEVASVTKSALETYLVRAQIEALCDVTQSGPRSFDPVHRPG